MSKFFFQKWAKEIHGIDQFLENGHDYSYATIQNIDFSEIDFNWDAIIIESTCFLGCTFTPQQLFQIVTKGAIVLPNQEVEIFKPYRSYMYTWQELYETNDNGLTKDYEIYLHFSNTKYNPTVKNSLYQRIHDHAIDDALRDYIMPDEDGNYKHKIIGIMGGHGTLRTDIFYSKVAHIARKLTIEGYLVVSGGGPGIMEATNLGAYMGTHSEQELNDAIKILAKAPYFNDEGFHESALEVLKKYPNGSENIAIPTWFYGHEPSNVFASHIAKYFSNSIREDTLLAISVHGILFAPGSAGTTQEIFMDAAQNHYKTFKYQSPMIFLGKKRYEKDTNLFSTLKSLSSGNYDDMIHLSDDVDEVVTLFKNNPPR